MSTDMTPGATSTAKELRGITSMLLRLAPWASPYTRSVEDYVGRLEEQRDALDAARRDAEARAARLNDALLIVAAIADDRGKGLSPYYPDTLSEDAQSEMGLHPGDVRRVARPQRGGEQS